MWVIGKNEWGECRHQLMATDRTLRCLSLHFHSIEKVFKESVVASSKWFIYRENSPVQWCNGAMDGCPKKGEPFYRYSKMVILVTMLAQMGLTLNSYTWHEWLIIANERTMDKGKRWRRAHTWTVVEHNGILTIPNSLDIHNHLKMKKKRKTSVEGTIQTMLTFIVQSSSPKWSSYMV